MRNLLWVLAAVPLALSCVGNIGGPPANEVPVSSSPPPEELPGGGGTCPSVPAASTLDGIADLFAKDVYPLMDRTPGQCLACHGAASGRSMIVPPTGAKDTFYKLRADGFLDRVKPGALRDRLHTANASARMPQGGPYWNAEETAKLDNVLCALEAYDKTSQDPPLDEQFPKELEQPWTGPANDYYDNTFISFVQLKGKVKSIFNDSWVRSGTDLFAKNIALFGGVDFKSTFVEARTATPEFLLGMDSLSRDVCAAAATNKTGPFAGLDTSASVRDTPPATTVQLEAEDMATKTVGAASPPGWIVWANGSVSDTANFNNNGAPGDYTVVVRAHGNFVDNAWSHMQVKVGTKLVGDIDVTSATYASYTFTAKGIPDGKQLVAVSFTNDYYEQGVGDRNLWVDWVSITGPVGTPTNGANEQAARGVIRQLYQRLLFRAVTPQEETDTYALLTDIAGIGGTLPQAWAGVCEALVKSPDFLFTLPPSIETASASDKKRLIAVKLAQDLVGRTPSASEFQLLETKSYDELVTWYFAQPEFRDFYFHRMQVRLESDGTPETDEPARLWTWLMLNDASFGDLLVADYTVDGSWKKAMRPAEHGKTGVLTMKGYIKNKPGLPHYNYAARVLTDFMGYVFEIPPIVFDMRDTATAATTVDPKSICFNCHQLLTPLSHQRLKWNDDGSYRETDKDGMPIDDSDRGMVSVYPYKGKGLESFSTIAVRKERFVRHTLNSQFNIFFGRPMRLTEDERVLYKQLWDVAHASNGKLKDVIRAIVNSAAYQKGVTP